MQPRPPMGVPDAAASCHQASACPSRPVLHLLAEKWPKFKELTAGTWWVHRVPDTPHRRLARSLGAPSCIEPRSLLSRVKWSGLWSCLLRRVIDCGSRHGCPQLGTGSSSSHPVHDMHLAEVALRARDTRGVTRGPGLPHLSFPACVTGPCWGF